ncbi:conjugal transfer protein TraR [Acinetobacter sp. ANC 4558]|uniref:TraR/DksA C4-type zinc finger protein n=1 Tax=Acinetobacter sp. ANC 4558 TaxID=1977876 RepID=UPI000A331F1F|nr:TraR/DksA C4-type zinc finger protein [Acinetobacter sp. ANC 4558]OTG87676.1 conjugal transfer protein TraR [Acinetobacter sp. ANC 4558]
MADLADIASEITDERLAQTLSNRTSYDMASEYECLECGEKIPEKRRALGGVTRCIGCQSAIEINNRLYR